MLPRAINASQRSYRHSPSQSIRRRFHDYYTPADRPEVRIPIAKAKAHLGIYSSRGDRPTNEDRYQVGVLNKLANRLDASSTIFYFAMIDGHGGAGCAEYVRDHLHDHIEGMRSREVAKMVSAWRKEVGGYFQRFRPSVLQDYIGGLDPDNTNQLTLEARLTSAFLQTDLAYVRTGQPSGAVASIALVQSHDGRPFWQSTNYTITSAHVGDTRIILCSTDRGGLAEALTTNHHPSSPAEAERLRRYTTAFSVDSFGSERFGSFANTRAFGDAPMKKVGVSAEPQLAVVDCDAHSYSFMCMVSDGVTGVLSDQEICDLVKFCPPAAGHATPAMAAENVVRMAETLGTDDNATCTVVRLPAWEFEYDKLDYTSDLRQYRLDNLSSRQRRM
ncbi:Protein phosphatase 2C 6 [Savitreella phatthalungensis]